MTAAKGRAVATCPTADLRQPMDVEALAIWAIRDQKADRTGGALFDVEAACDRPDWEPRGSSRDGVAEMLRRRETGGCRVDGGGPMRGVQPRVHPDAEAIVDAILSIRDRRQRGLVFEYAQLGDRPDWSNGAQALVPVPVPESRRGAVRHVIAAEWETQPLRSEFCAICTPVDTASSTPMAGTVFRPPRTGSATGPSMMGGGRSPCAGARWSRIPATPGS